MMIFSRCSAAARAGILVLLALIVNIQPASAGVDFRGTLLVNDYNGHNILAFDPDSGEYKGVFATMPGNTISGYMAQGPNGNIYVSNYFYHSAVEFDGVTGQQIASFSLQSPDPFAIIIGLAFDKQGNLYAANAGATNQGTIDQYDPVTGAFVRQVVGGLSTPRGLVFTNDSLYATTASSTGIGAIVQVSLTGQVVRTFGSPPTSERPQGLTLGTNGNLFATDGVSSIYQYTPDGVQVGAGAFAASPQIIATYGAGFGPNGTMYVVDDTGPVYKFDSAGQMIGAGPFIPKAGAGYELLYPVQPLYNLAPVPEPASIILVVSSLAVLAVSRVARRTRKA